MYRSKLFQILKSFEKEDWKAAAAFVLMDQRPESDCTILFEYIKSKQSDLGHRSLGLEIVRKKLFPNKSKKGIQNVMSKLVPGLQDYLRWSYIKSRPGVYDLSLLQAYNQRGLYNHFDRLSQKMWESYDTQPRLDLWAPYERIQHLDMLMFSNNPNRLDLNASYVVNSLEESITFSDRQIHFILLGLWYYKIYLGQNLVDKEIELYEAKLNPNSNDDVVQILRWGITIIKEQNKLTTYQKLSKILIQHGHQYDPNITFLLLEVLIRFSINQYKAGNIEMSISIYELYRYGIISKAYLKNGQLEANRFHNIVSALSSMNQRNMAIDFLNEYIHLVDTNMQREASVISQAQIHFDANEHDDVVLQLSRINFLELRFSMRMRWLLLCSNFILHRTDKDYMDNVIRNYFNFFNHNRSKISPVNYKASINLGRAIALLMKSFRKSTLDSFLSQSKTSFSELG